MKELNRQTYGPTPDAFKELVASSLQQKEKRQIQTRPRIGVLVLAALLVIAIGATALAVAHRAGLIDFFAMIEQEGYTMDVAPRHIAAPGQNLLEATHDTLEITVAEAMGDGRQYAFCTTVSLQPGVEGHLWPFIGEEYAGPDDGKPVYYVTVTILSNGMAANTGLPEIFNDDGSISFYDHPPVNAVEQEVDMVCQVRLYKGSAHEENYNTRFEKEALTDIPFVMPIMEAVETRAMQAPVTMADTGITLRELKLKRTEYDAYCSLRYAFTGGEGVEYHLPASQQTGGKGILFRFYDEQGNALQAEDLPISPNPWQGGIEYLQGYRLAVDTLPERITVEVYDSISDMVRATETIDLEGT